MSEEINRPNPVFFSDFLKQEYIEYLEGEYRASDEILCNPLFAVVDKAKRLTYMDLLSKELLLVKTLSSKLLIKHILAWGVFNE